MLLPVGPLDMPTSTSKILLTVSRRRLGVLENVHFIPDSLEVCFVCFVHFLKKLTVCLLIPGMFFPLPGVCAELSVFSRREEGNSE